MSEQATEINEKEVMDKYNKGEALSEKEIEFVMGQTHSKDSAGDVGADQLEDKDFGEDKDDKKDTDKKSEPEKEDKEKSEKADEKDDSKKEEKSEEKKEKKKEPEKPEGINIEKVEEMLEGKIPEDTTKLTMRETAYYFKMKEYRFRAQRAEEDRDMLRFQIIKGKADKKVEEKPEGEDNKEDDTELVTKKDLKELAETLKGSLNKTDVTKKTKEWFNEGVAKHGEEFDKVCALGEFLIEGNDFYESEIASAVKAGRNPAFKMFELIKADPKFKMLYIAKYGKEPGVVEEKKEEKKVDEKLDPKKEALEKNNKLNKNLDKPGTSASKGGGSGAEGATEFGDYTADQIMRMNETDFGKLPKVVRDNFLKKFG